MLYYRKGGKYKLNTEFYRQMLDKLRESECSKREFAKLTELHYATVIEFFDTKRIFRPLSVKTMSRIHRNLGISYEVMEDYNKQILKERGK